MNKSSLSMIRQVMAHYQPKPLGVTKQYAVLMPLIQTEDELSLLYEARATGISQAGDAAFPGEHLWGMTAELTARWSDLVRKGDNYEK
ncbi:MAG: hypothetical protein Q4A55_05985 [Aerococcus sp.]|nr:hypothetical protein [Aerococcus sp.]